MAINKGPIVFLTPGSAESLAALPGLATFAATLGHHLTVLHPLGRPDTRSRVDAALAALEPGRPPAELRSVAPGEVDAVLAGFAETSGGIVALLPKRPRPLDRLLLGSEYERLIESGPLPVLALPQSGQIAQPSRVLFPADLAPRSVTALDATIALCLALGAELHLLHVFGDDRRLPTELDLEQRRTAPNPRALLQIDQNHLCSLAERAAAQGVRARQQTAEGRAHEQILSYAASASIDLIVMPSHGPRSIEDILRGSTTARVIQGAAAPVLAMHS